MTAEQERLLKNFETRVRQCILRIEELQKENDSLKAALAEKEESFQALKEDWEKITIAYDKLKLAKSMAGREGELRDAQQQLSKMVREINACIALVNEQ